MVFALFCVRVFVSAGGTLAWSTTRLSSSPSLAQVALRLHSEPCCLLSKGKISLRRTEMFHSLLYWAIY